MAHTMRAFIAIDLPQPVKETIAGLQSALPVGRAVETDNFHLTLAFLGEQTEDLIEEAHHGLQHVSSPPLELRLSGLDTFGSGDPSVLFVGVAQNEPLGHLRKLVRGAMHGAGINLDRERFRPHVTLARFRRGLTPYELEKLKLFLSGYADFGVEPFTVTSFALYRSILRPEGAIHEPLAQYRLG